MKDKKSGGHPEINGGTGPQLKQNAGVAGRKIRSRKKKGGALYKKQQGGTGIARG